MSTCYYAMFHAVCETCADSVTGTSSVDRSNAAWLQTYRAVEHGPVKARCRNPKISRFPKSVEDFAIFFAQMQEERHSADYDPKSRYTRSEVMIMIDAAEAAIGDLRRTRMADRRAFAALILFKNR